MLKKIIYIILLLPFLSCQPRQHDGPVIAVSIPPQAWFVSQIAGDYNLQTLVLAGAGQNPHNYEPAPKQIQSLSGAGAWILSGCEFEISLVPKVKKLFPNLAIIDGTQGVNFRLLDDHDCNDHGSHAHSSLEIDRHTWLGREPAKILAMHVRDTLNMIQNLYIDYHNERYEDLIALIDDEFDKLKTVLAPLSGKTVFVYHPSFGYFFDEFNIHQEAVETGGKEPSPRMLNDLMARLKEEQAKIIFVQAQYPSYAAKTLAEAAGARLVNLDPLAEDWLANIRLMGDALIKVLP